METVINRPTNETTTPVSIEEAMHNHILEHVVIPETDIPNLILIMGPCRTATGALITVLNRSEQVRGHVQPLKAIGRRFLAEQFNQDSSTKLEFISDTMQILPGAHFEAEKETFGPDPLSPAEFLDPLEIFLAKGFPPERITIIPTMREPLETADSWEQMWKWGDGNFPVDGFNKSFLWTADICSRAEEKGIRVVPYIHELGRDHTAAEVVKRMFEVIGLDFREGIVNWGDEDAYWDSVKYDRPPIEFVQGSLGKKQGGRGGFFWKPHNLNWSQQQQSEIAESIQAADSVYLQMLNKARSMLRF